MAKMLVILIKKIELGRVARKRLAKLQKLTFVTKTKTVPHGYEPNKHQGGVI